MNKSKRASVRKLTLASATVRDLAPTDLVTVGGGLPPITRFPACTQNRICQ